MLHFMDFFYVTFLLFFFFLFRWGFRLLFLVAAASSVKSKTKQGADFLKKKFEGDGSPYA